MQISRCINALVAGLKSTHAIISPGSRNAPLIYSLNQYFKHTYSIIDERSAGFIALGMAKAKKLPVVLNCTSGTAVLNYYPAIAEAYYARVPLIVITADRPPEKIDTWDGQAIRQTDIFKKHIRLSTSTPADYNDVGAFERVANQVNEYLEKGIPGPIHINVPIREPFYEFNQDSRSPFEIEGKTKQKTVSLLHLQEHLGRGFSGNNILIFNGQQAAENVKVDVDCLAWQTVELSDITSNIQGELDYWDGLLFTHEPNSVEELAPDILITTGTTTVSKGLKQFLTKFKPREHYHISHYKEVGAMFGTKAVTIHPDNCLKVSGKPLIGMAQWTDFKRSWVARTESFTNDLLNLPWSEWNEFTATKKVLENIPENSILHLANSMPIRYSSYLQSILNSKNIEVQSNRGTSGIDGCTSTAIGHALATTKNVYLLIGDIAFLYDNNAFLNQVPGNLKIVVLNNNGGGIFEVISGPEKMDDAQRFQTTKHTLNLEKVVAAFDIKYYQADRLREITRYMEKISDNEKLSIIEIKTDSTKNLAFYKEFKRLSR